MHWFSDVCACFDTDRDMHWQPFSIHSLSGQGSHRCTFYFALYLRWSNAKPAVREVPALWCVALQFCQPECSSLPWHNCIIGCSHTTRYCCRAASCHFAAGLAPTRTRDYAQSDRSIPSSSVGDAKACLKNRLMLFPWDRRKLSRHKLSQWSTHRLGVNYSQL